MHDWKPRRLPLAPTTSAHGTNTSRRRSAVETQRFQSVPPSPPQSAPSNIAIVYCGPTAQMRTLVEISEFEIPACTELHTTNRCAQPGMFLTSLGIQHPPFFIPARGRRRPAPLPLYLDAPAQKLACRGTLALSIVHAAVYPASHVPRPSPASPIAPTPIPTHCDFRT
ncbi:hypothetical protein MSAN_00647500 [Mycena sanguinolenta]|uniref:Uncharacterized protein n=1 Tax=Mycena sanguinolenta TaxID=230812 RepID=A0A8H6Z012_9AGAR|nr:hypothetical protein MSAN_00647500 [Mycena sanguinolenta]